VVTAGGLVFIAASPDARIHAYAQSSGELLWEHELPQAGFATPSVYEANGRQFIVIAAGGGKLGQPSGSHYVAFALPVTPP
jgi:quinoprotein glucose dehydrogenase